MNRCEPQLKIKIKINSKDFQVQLGAKVEFKKWPTKVKPFCKSKKQYKKFLRHTLKN